MARKIDLRPQVLDLLLYAGDGVDITLTITDVNDAPVNITGTVDAQIRANRTDPGTTGIVSFDSDLTNASTGIVALTLSGDDVDALITSAGGKKFNGFWDVQWTPSGAEPRTLCQGKVECDIDVTRVP